MYLTTIQQESFKNSDPHYIDEFIALKLGMMIGMWRGREKESEMFCVCVGMGSAGCACVCYYETGIPCVHMMLALKPQHAVHADL